MKNTKRTRKEKIIIAVALTNAVVFASPLQITAKVDCQVNDQGMCMLPATDDDLELDEELDAEEEEEPRQAENRKIIAVQRKTADCSVLENIQLSFVAKLAGELHSLQRQIILKAKKAGKLLQVHNIFAFMKECGLGQDRHKVCDRKQRGIPYKIVFFPCAEKS